MPEYTVTWQNSHELYLFLALVFFAPPVVFSWTASHASSSPRPSSTSAMVQSFSTIASRSVASRHAATRAHDLPAIVLNVGTTIE